MIEVRRHPTGWRWTFISDEGRVLWADPTNYSTDCEAWNAARDRRSSFQRLSRETDDE